jgi:hypothetical protein
LQRVLWALEKPAAHTSAAQPSREHREAASGQHHRRAAVGLGFAARKRRRAPVRLGALSSERGTSQRPGALILVRRISGVMFSTVSVRLRTSAPSSGWEPLPRSVSAPISPLSAQARTGVTAAAPPAGAGAGAAVAAARRPVRKTAAHCAPEGVKPPARLYALAPALGRKHDGMDSGAPRPPTVSGIGAKQQPRALHWPSVTPFQPAQRSFISAQPSTRAERASGHLSAHDPPVPPAAALHHALRSSAARPLCQVLVRGGRSRPDACC